MRPGKSCADYKYYVAFLTGRAANRKPSHSAPTKLRGSPGAYFLIGIGSGHGEVREPRGVRGFMHSVGHERIGGAGCCIPVVLSYVFSCADFYVEEGKKEP